LDNLKLTYLSETNHNNFTPVKLIVIQMKQKEKEKSARELEIEHSKIFDDNISSNCLLLEL